MTFVINCKIIYKLDASNQGKEKVFSLFLEESLFLMKNSDKKKILALCTVYAPNLIELLKLFQNEKSYTLLAISIMVSIYSRSPISVEMFIMGINVSLHIFGIWFDNNSKTEICNKYQLFLVFVYT